MIDIKYSAAAKNDLQQIGDYIAEQLNNPKSAFGVVNKIQDKVDKLVEFPLMGTPVSSVFDIETDDRFLVCGNYLVFYRTKKDEVFVDRILYGKRDYIAILFGEHIEQIEEL